MVEGAKRGVTKQGEALGGPDGTRAQRGPGIGPPPRRHHLDRGTAPAALTAARPKGWRACVSPLTRAHVSGPPADVVVFMNTGTQSFVRASAFFNPSASCRVAPLPQKWRNTVRGSS